MKTYLFLLIAGWAHAINWPIVIQGIQTNPQQFQLVPVYGGASNVNYHLTLDGSDYFIRFAPELSQELYADLEAENLALTAIKDLQISPKPLYYDPTRRILVTEWLENSKSKIDLLDPKTRKETLRLLHQIEQQPIVLHRTFHPYADVMKLVDKAERLGVPLPQKFLDLLPALQSIDKELEAFPKLSLCHLDLHHKNLISAKDRLWIIDWEYATMGHPFLVLASMASIERWDDAQMRDLLKDYTPNPTAEDETCLFLYRIAIDMFWTAWNHLQMHCSPIQNPYEQWRDLFFAAAEQRILLTYSRSFSAVAISA